MLNAAKVRSERSEVNVVDSFPSLRTIDKMLFWGVFSWAIPSEKRRLVKRSTMLTLGNLPLTPGDAVRDYLDFWHKNTMRATGAEARLWEDIITAPLHVRRGILIDGTYIDIRSAFFSIVKMVGWNINYMPNGWINPGRAPLDFPFPEVKSARNYLVSISLPSVITMWTGAEMVYKPGKNAHINRALWRLVMDVLHSIAAFAVSLGAIYIHTDGYILPTSSAGKLFDYITAFGLTPRVVAQGEALVVGFGNYLIGDKKTAIFDASKVQVDHTYIVPAPADWLQRNLAKIRYHDYPQRLYERSLQG